VCRKGVQQDRKRVTMLGEHFDLLFSDGDTVLELGIMAVQE
jgi:hypothetical protein